MLDEVGRDFECRLATSDREVSPAEIRLRQARWSVPVESPLSIWINHQQWMTLMCTPTARRHLVLGVVYFAGLFQTLGQVLLLHDCPDDPNRMEMTLAHEIPTLPTNRLITSGCGQGVSPDQIWPDYRVPPAAAATLAGVRGLMGRLQEESAIHRAVGGTHASALADRRGILALYEDIGRHNTIDKLMGHALLTGLDTSGLTLVTSGRVSSEMIYKAVRMKVSTVVSRTAPTDVAVDMAIRYGLTLVGYARGSRYTLFAAPEKLLAAYRSDGN